MNMEELKNYILNNIHKISQSNTKEIPDFNKRILHNIKKLGG